MKIENLRRWLARHGIEVAEDRQQADGSRVIQFVTELPSFPHAGRRAWYSLVLDKDQTDVSEDEIGSLLRHCWHGELPIPRDEEV